MSRLCCLLILAFTCALLTGCGQEAVSEKTSDGSADLSQGDSGVKPTEGPPLPQPLADFLAEQMPSWRLLPADLWLTPQYIADYNAIEQINDKIAYPDNVFAQGDFNGDRLTDYAGFFMDDSGKVELLAFHSRPSLGLTFQRYLVKSLFEVKQCCMGAGLAVRPPGRYAQPFDKAAGPKNIATDCLLLMYFEKSAQVFFFDGSAYSSFFSSD